MTFDFYESVKRISKSRIGKFVFRRGFISAAAVVVFVTTYMLILPAITKNAKVYCGLDEHQHSESCYKIEKVLTCDKAESEGHTHSDSCYGTDTYLVCGLEESEGHTHSESCYDEEGNLVCGLEESKGHQHSERCYAEEKYLTCGKEESKGHKHTEACYKEEKSLCCGKEEHVHTEACYTDYEADLETEAFWESTFSDVELTGDWSEDVPAIAKTQIGYQESEKNFITNKRGDRKGYTRYGAWYGDSYGDWDAMFASFVYHYAEVDEDLFPSEAEAGSWVKELKEKDLFHSDDEAESGTYDPKPGDLVIFGESKAEQVGIVVDTKTRENDQDQEVVTKVTVIQGDYKDAVKSTDYSIEDDSIRGFGELPENPELKDKDKSDEPDTKDEVSDEAESDEAESDESDVVDETEAMDEEETEEAFDGTYTKNYLGVDYEIRVTYTEEAGLPEDVLLHVRELKGEELEEKLLEAKDVMGLSTVTFARLFDITFMDGEEEIEPKAPVEVEIIYDHQPALAEEDTGNVVHFADEGTEVIDMNEAETEDGKASFTFTQSSFSVSGTVFGVEADYGISLAAVNSDPAPAVGNLTAVNVTEPTIGKWYILYGVNANGGTGYAISATPTSGAANPVRQLQLSQASTNRGTVKYQGNQDIAWEYTENGFRNRNGQYLTATYDNNYWSSNVNMSSASTNAGVIYDSTYHILYNQQRVNNGWGYYTNWYNEFWFHDYDTEVTGLSFRSLQEITRGDSMPAYIAEIQPERQGNRHPQGAVTGNPTGSELTLYNIDASTGNSVQGLKGVEYTIYDSNDNPVKSFTTTDDIVVHIGTLPDGNYTIKQTGVPDGYVINAEARDFTVKDGTGFIGVFYDYRLGDNGFVVDKTAEVVDYINRTYKVNLAAKSGAYKYNIRDINYELIVDQSNSMLFPSELTPVTYNGQPVKVWMYQNSNGDGYTGRNGYNLTQLVNEGKLDINKVYYMIADENTTSTVYAIWHDGNGWCYQDAAYYCKAQMYWDHGITQNTLEQKSNGTWYYPEYAKPNHGYSTGNETGGGGLDYVAYDNKGNVSAVGGTLGKEFGTGKQMILYEGSTYNRLHDLQQAVVVLGGQLGSLNEDTSLDLITFDKEVESCVTIDKLDSDGIKKLVTAVDNITTSGGTRQDKALKHVIGEHGGNNTANHTRNHLSSDKENIVILITDGAPVNSSSTDTVTLDGCKSAADAVKKKDNMTALISVGLSMKNVKGGTDFLQYAASTIDGEKYYYESEQAGELTDILLRNILLKFGTREVIESSVDAKDVISDSFYPINPVKNKNDEYEPLESGTKINLNGFVDPDGPGTVLYDTEKKEWYVEWDEQLLGTGTPGSTITKTEYIYTNRDGTRRTLDPAVCYNIQWGGYDGAHTVNGTANFGDSSKDRLYFDGTTWKYRWKNTNKENDAMDRISKNTETITTPASPTWHGNVYLKAKEDFIGGNSIDTNKEATMTLISQDGDRAEEALTLSEPNVNVRLLEMRGFESEETVFLGDEIKDIKEKLEYLFKQTVVEKIVDPSAGDPYNKVGMGENDGVYADYFTLGYAARDLSPEEWNQLLAGQPVTLEYTYDDNSSDGAVGYFTLQLTKEGDTAKTIDHESTVVGDDVEEYKLTVTYTAYSIAQRDKVNDHNGQAGPGTEVGRGATIPEGRGTESVDELHIVNVVAGKVKVTKEIDAGLKSDKDQTFIFYLDESGNTSATEENAHYQTVEVIVKAGETTGYKEVSPVKRGTYILREQASDDYLIENVEVQNDTTCVTTEVTEGDTEITFTIGTNRSLDSDDKNVIILVNEVVDGRYIYTDVAAGLPTDETRSYEHGKVVNKKAIYEGEIPVEKIWADGNDQHEKDEVYVVLYRDNNPVVDEDGNAKLLKLSADNNWKGSYTVQKLKKNDDVMTYGYYVREVCDMKNRAEEDFFGAKIVPDGTDVKYVKTAGEGDYLYFGKNGYQVSYQADGQAVLTITNSNVYELPKTGGIGTNVATMWGKIIVLLSLLCIFISKLKVQKKEY